ncbi:MAG TPA: 3-dehydroquinate synthase [Nitrospiraceae bacterium]|nr:3-dehydroquinate synthase [Nitrospiraceae bacterium]
MIGGSTSHTVPVELGERRYRIIIDRGLLSRTGAILHELGCKGKVGVVTDRNLARLHLRPLIGSLRNADFETVSIVLPPGERTKSLRTVERILDQLVGEKFERRSTLLALGGGVIGDLTGFAAAIYLRGIPFIQLPTSLVAQVDSSVGGKTGVDHRLGKNLIGAFHQPRCVLIDTATLRTLPTREWIAGLAEVIKYGVIADEGFFEFLERNIERILHHDEDAVSRIITRSCEIKAQVVAEDERESDRRRILNFGHTIAHALEALSGYRGLVHGEAVGIGMVQEADIARHLGLGGLDAVERIRGLVRAAGLPSDMPGVPFARLWEAMQSDKKVLDGTIYCVLPRRIGDVAIVPLNRQDCARWFAALAAGRRGPRPHARRRARISGRH